MSGFDNRAGLAERIKKVFETQKIPHAFYLLGADFLSSAKELAAAILCEKKVFPPCGVCAHCVKCKKEIHPDLSVIATDKAQITVDMIRAMRLDAFVLPNDSERKVYIIAEAAKMNINAQNAFLKILEQPPGGVYFILADSHQRGILPTVLSRVTQITLRQQAENADGEDPLLTTVLAGETAKTVQAVEKAFANDREKAIRAVDAFMEAAAALAVSGGAGGQRAEALYEAGRKTALLLENAVNVNLCAAQFLIEIREALF